MTVFVCIFVLRLCAYICVYNVFCVLRSGHLMRVGVIGQLLSSDPVTMYICFCVLCARVYVCGGGGRAVIIKRSCYTALSFLHYVDQISMRSNLY